MSTKRPAYQTSQKVALPTRAEPIGEAELALMQDAMAEVAPEWSVELHGICVDEATLVLLPEDGDDANGPSFLISREKDGFLLDQVHWDEVTEVGVFETINGVVAALRCRLAFSFGWVAPASSTRH